MTFFCHDCNTQMIPLTQELKCSICSSEFIQEVEDAHDDIEVIGRLVNIEDVFRTMNERRLPGTPFQFGFSNRQLPQDQTNANADLAGHNEQVHPHQIFDYFMNLPVQNEEGRRNDSMNAFINHIQQIITQGAENLGDYAGEDITDLVERLMEEGGNKVIPCSAATINALKTTGYTQASAKEHKECPICQDDFEIDQIIVELDCKHIFCKNCVIDWLKLNGTCPVCRYSMVEVETEPTSNTNVGTAQPRPTVQYDIDYMPGGFPDVD